MTNTITAEQIHKDFYGAEEKLYVEAVGLSKGSLVANSSKSDRLKKIGFSKSKPIKDDQILQEKRKISGHVLSAIEYFRQHYPNNKFITEPEVKTLCEKYGLLLGDASEYTGDMPEKNLTDIEKFKLKKEDWEEKISFSWYERALSQYPINERGQIMQIPRRTGVSLFSDDRLLAQYYALMSSPPPSVGYVTGFDPYTKGENKKEYEQPAFKICAPKEDFDTRGFIIQDGHKLIYDPIVLQPVSKEGIGGYLIVTAWGDEASDENVVNEKLN